MTTEKKRRIKMQRSRKKKSLLDEHWKRKQRLKVGWTTKLNGCQTRTRSKILEEKRVPRKTAVINDILRAATVSKCLNDTSITRWWSDWRLKQESKHREAAREFSILPDRGLSADILTRRFRRSISVDSLIILMLFICCQQNSQAITNGSSGIHGSRGMRASVQPQAFTDPRPTIYSGQVSFGLLLSAHSSLGAELSTSASQQRSALMALVPSLSDAEGQENSNTLKLDTMTTILPAPLTTGAMGFSPSDSSIKTSSSEMLNTSSNSLSLSEPLATSESAVRPLPSSTYANQTRSQEFAHQLSKRQIFEQRQTNVQKENQRATAASSGSHPTRQSQFVEMSASCNQINANALYAGMGAIWASHQANLVGDSQLTIGTYVYDSCNDLDVGQRQSVRIVANLNAFQQTTCEAPRGSPISLTIAHGDNQLSAIQLLTSFRVPVITTKEPFEFENYNQLSREQKRFLFSTAHSSRHLAIGALRFTKRIVARLSISPKLPNQYHKNSPKNGLIVISENLPSKFINYLREMIPNHVNYKIVESHRPIDQIKSVEALEYILANGASLTTSSSESRISKIIMKRQDGDSLDSVGTISDDIEGTNAESNTNQEEDQQKIPSPTIIMFITPSEAIDLVTRLRNDLADVSRYYSLIVATREDISPALQTIFHRGGSRLCSGKAFYTISPKPDDIGEFSRYFRDTIQMEGENSDHPLICEYAKYKSMTKTSSDLDDIGTEPVIKAVWTAAAAFKSVYKKECGTLSSTEQTPSSTMYRAQSNGPGSTAVMSDGRAMNTRQSGSKTSECVVKMNKNLSNLVQRALKRLDVTINSTGLQALDGFRIKFDDLNDLMTNKFSIKYINKECEITELGHYSGLGDSNLRLDEDTLVKSLESTLPDAWPAKPVALVPQTQSTVTGGDALQKIDGSAAIDSSSPTKKVSPARDTTSSDIDSSTVDTSGRENGRRNKSSIEEESSPASGMISEEDDGIANGPVEKGGVGSESTYTETPIGASLIPFSNKRPNKQTLNESRRAPRKRTEASHASPKKRQQPVTANGKGLAILHDSETTTQSITARGRVQQSDFLDDLSSVRAIPTKQMRELKPFPAQTIGTTLKEWIPSSVNDVTSTSTRQPDTTNTYPRMPVNTNRLHDIDNERVYPSQMMDLKLKGTTQAPIVYTTLPESDGNTNLDHPPTKATSRRRSKQTTPRVNLETSATTESSDYIASASLDGATNSPVPLGRLGILLNNPLNNQTYRAVSSSGIDAILDHKSSSTSRLPTRLNFVPPDIDTSPMPHVIPTTLATGRESNNLKLAEAALLNAELDPLKVSRPKLRSHLKWMYSSWFGLTILVANICGALITLYILTFLLFRNCDGPLDRDNQGIRSLHLLAIIVMFFGSTLFIVFPTPGLCLLRTSWQNFALALLFGSLLLQTMQARSMRTLGLGGRPDRLNQFLTLVFMVGVQVSYELQRWKYESSNYLNFVHQHFGSGTTEINQKLSMLTSSITSQFNPLDSFNDQVTPVSIQVSEQYQRLLSEYCTQKPDEFLQSQIYLFILVLILIIFSASTRRTNNLVPKSHQSCKAMSSRRKLTSAALGVASGNLVASQHEANITPSQFQSPFTSTSSMNGANLETGNVFVVSMICIPIYIVSIFLHLSGQSTINRDLIPSVTMVTIAFSALIGIFLPVLRQIHCYEDVADASLAGGVPTTNSALDRQVNISNSSPISNSAAFTMFPEFAPHGHRRPSSTSGESGSGAGSRKPFAETKESRRNMGTMLANLSPSADSLRSMGLYHDKAGMEDVVGKIDPGILNLKLNLGANKNPSTLEDTNVIEHPSQRGAKQSSKNEKRLIMLDVDPCCPRHGVAAWPRDEASPSKSCRYRSSHARH